LTVHAGREAGCSMGHLEPFLFSEIALPSDASSLGF
jgi:hypothetical protein